MSIMQATVSYLLMLRKLYQFKAKNSEIKNYTLCLVNILKDFTNNVKPAALKGIVKIFCLLT